MSGKIAGNADVAPTIGAVPSEIDIEHNLALQPKRDSVGHTQRSVVRQDQNSAVVVT